MNKEQIETLQKVTAGALAAQVRRTLDVARIRGWAFPEECDIAVKVLAATPLVTQIQARMDDVVIPQAMISPEDAAKGIMKVSDSLVAEWLKRHATAKPEGKRG